jgi:tetratricopeptide (TPR) repeat protein
MLFFKDSLGRYFIFIGILSIGFACRMSTSQPETVIPNSWDQMIEASPWEDSLYFHRAQDFYLQGEWLAAIADLEYAIRLDSTVSDYFHLLADAYLDNNQSYEALQTMRKAVNLFPSYLPSKLKLAEFQYLLKLYDQSIITCRQIVADRPVEAEAFFMMGMNYKALKDSLQAIEMFRKACTYDDQLADGWMILAGLIKTKDSSYARQCIENALRVDSVSSSIKHAYAEFFQDSEPLRSIATYQDIIQSDPDYIDAYLNLGILYFSQDSFPKAIEHFSMACAKDPLSAKFKYFRGTAYEAIGNIGQAKKDYADALALDPQNESIQDALRAIQ